MKLQIKKWGTSKVIILPSYYCKIYKFEKGDIVKVSLSHINKDDKRKSERGIK